MKKISLLVFALLLGSSFAMLHAQTPDASIVMSSQTAPTAANMEFLYQPDANDEPYTIAVTKGGLQCIEIPATKYAYFRTTNGAIADSDRDLIVEITYFDEGTGGLQFQYNSTTSDHQTQNLAKTGTNTWVTATIALTDASFRKRQRGANGWDFRIGAGNFIREITIAKGTLNPESVPVVEVEASAYSEFTGKSVAGYQAWFRTGSNGGWFHWSDDNAPSPGNLKFEVYPDVTEYDAADMEQSGFANLGNRQPAMLFNSANTNVINTHFEWMQTYGIDGVAVQRFINGIGTAINTSPASHLIKIKNAAEANNRIFYICYDISSTGLDETWDDIIKFDWVYNIEKTFELTGSPAYAKVGNKPVVQLWGTGLTDNHPGNAQETIALINFLKSRGCYVIGGVPTRWRTETDDSKPDFMDAYNAYDMLSPWLVGRFSDNSGANDMFSTMQADKAHCDARGIAYMPVIFPGFAWSQWNGAATGTSGQVNEAPRNAGEFMWQQAKNIKSLGVGQMYFAMFDEYDEGTALMKAATDWTMIPTNQFFQTTSIDGYWLSSDFQLRVAGAAIDMLKSAANVLPPANVPVPHSEGPVYYRNSFEQRTTAYNYYGNPKVSHGTGTFPLDPCFKNPAEISANGVSGNTSMETAQKKSGLYSARITGNATAANGTYYYKFADAKIQIKAGMELSFSKYTSNELGKFTSVSLLFDDGTYLHNLDLKDTDCVGISPANARGEINQWTDHKIIIGKGDLIGKTITGIVLGFAGNAAGNFTAYFDNLLIADGNSTDCNQTSLTDTNASIITLYVENGQILSTDSNAKLAVYDIVGKEVVNRNLPQGVYVVKALLNGKIETFKVLVK